MSDNNNVAAHNRKVLPPYLAELITGEVLGFAGATAIDFSNVFAAQEHALHLDMESRRKFFAKFGSRPAETFTEPQPRNLGPSPETKAAWKARKDCCLQPDGAVILDFLRRLVRGVDDHNLRIEIASEWKLAALIHETCISRLASVA